MKQLCQHCGKNPATVNYRETKNGKSREFHLCTACAAKLGLVDIQDNLFSLSSFPLFSPSTLHTRPKKEEACPLCGTTLSQIQKKGKFGCSTCYDTFREKLDLTPYVGKGYGEAQAPDVQKKKEEADPVAALKAELKKAVAAEDYERAATLRDKIRAKEGK